MELQRGGQKPGRGREGLSGPRGPRRSKDRNGCDERAELPEESGLREQKHHRVGKGNGRVAAAGHRTTDASGRVECAAAVMVAFVGWILLDRSPARFATSRAETSVATGHVMSLPASRPKWSPKQENGKETHERGESSSWSESSTERLSHFLRIVIVTRFGRGAPCATAQRSQTESIVNPVVS